MSGIVKNKPYPLYDTPFAKSLKDIVLQQAGEDPDRTAFRYRSRGTIAEKTIGEFLADINHLGTWLFCTEPGGGAEIPPGRPGDIKKRHIAIAAPNSYLWIVVYFAVVTSGNVIVPIDREYPASDIAGLMKQADCEMGFVSPAIYKKLTAGDETGFAGSENRDGAMGAPVLHSMEELESILEKGRGLIKRGRQEYLHFEPDPEDVASIVFTSGTTGGSKGVMITHKNLLADINHGCQTFYTGGESVMSVLPFHHLFGINVSLMMMLHWKCNIFLNTGKKYLLPDLKEAKAVHTQLVPLHIQAIYRMIMQKAKNEGKYKKLRFAMKLGMLLYSLGIDIRRKLTGQVSEAFGGRMEYIIVGGAPLDPFYEKEFRAWGISLIAAYGATECSPGISLNRNHHYRDGSVGRPIGACRVKIADDGEILVSGDIVMKGYYRDEEATKAVLRDGWYHTGDIGYLDGDGFLFITGRKKNLIILSDGENISPETIESRIGMIDGVSEVMVYAEGDEIVAQIFPMEGEEYTEAYFENEIRKLNSSLGPSHRVRHVKLRDTEFPKNASMKIKRFEVIK